MPGPHFSAFVSHFSAVCPTLQASFCIRNIKHAARFPEVIYSRYLHGSLPLFINVPAQTLPPQRPFMAIISK